LSARAVIWAMVTLDLLRQNIHVITLAYCAPVRGSAFAIPGSSLLTAGPLSGLRLTALTGSNRPAKLPPRNASGQVAEWLKAHAWRACKRQKRFEGSNPSLSVPSKAYPSRRHCIPMLDRLSCGMIVVPPCSRASPFGRPIRLLMMVIGIASVPSVGPEALQRPHCVQHRAAAIHGGHLPASQQVAAGRESPSWTKAATHNCPHCPDSECARAARCASSPLTALSPTRVAVNQNRGSRTTVRLDRDHALSVPSSPETPPPQLIA
jgi:hypothetical protein